MTQIAYLLLCHKDPEEIISQAVRLTAVGDCVAIHFDARSSLADYTRVRAALADNPAVAFASRRMKCGWGEWSLVAATLEVARAAITAFPEATHFYLLSGDCMPIKTAEHIHTWLETEDADFIECVDFVDGGWIKTGIQEERLIYRHWFNERKRKRLFYASMGLQKWLGLGRQVPTDLKIHIGSQWWCLRRRTIEAVLDFADRRPDVRRFFATTWIPDEIFFQTLVAHLVPAANIRSRTLTFLVFTDYGVPVTFHNDHHDLLLAQDYLFARKISPDASILRERLGALYSETGRSFETGADGRRRYQFLAERGREGRRYASRRWESGTSLGAGRILLLIACKKWHVGKRLAARIRSVTGLQGVDYFFDETGGEVPDLGGIERTLEKRMRHRRAVMRMVFDAWEADRLLLCVDPGSIDVIRDFASDRARVRLLHVDCALDDTYLAGHAERMGLVGPHTPRDVVAQLMPTVRQDLRFESERLRELDVTAFFRLRETATTDEKAAILAEFLGLPPDTSREIAMTDHLFDD
jgi:hypothetical protein